jgi:hypothetical protein
MKWAVVRMRAGPFSIRVAPRRAFRVNATMEHCARDD